MNYSQLRLLAILALTTTLNGCLLWYFPTRPESQPPRIFSHTIRIPGETLGIISQWYTGTPSNWREIERATPGLKANRLQLGQTVYIPESLVKNKKSLPKEFVLKFASSNDSPGMGRDVSEEPADTKPIEGMASGGSSSAIDRQLYDAIMFADVARVKELLKSGANSNSGEQGRSMLGWAAQSGSPEIVALLIANGAALDAIDNRGYSALLFAAVSNQLPTVKVLLQAGSDPAVVAHDGKSALNLAIEHNNLEMARALISAGADSGKIGNKGLSPLLSAIQNDASELVSILLNAHANPNDNRGNFTPLSYAAARQNNAIVALLIKAGADVNLAPDQGDAPLFEALTSASIMRMLLAAGAQPNVRNRRGETALAIVIQRGTKAEVATLIAAGADITMPTASGQSPLGLALSLGETEIAALLKANGAE